MTEPLRLHTLPSHQRAAWVRGPASCAANTLLLHRPNTGATHSVVLPMIGFGVVEGDASERLAVSLHMDALLPYAATQRHFNP